MSKQLKTGLVACAIILAFIAGLTLGRSGTRQSSATPPPASGSSAPPPTDTVLTLGEQAVNQQSGSKITTFTWKDRVRIDGRTFGQADIQWCAGHLLGQVSYVIPLWSVQTDLGNVAAESVGYTSRSLGRNERMSVNPGDCVRGLLEFDIPKGAHPSYLIFSGTEVFKWALGPVATASPSAVTPAMASP